MKETKIQWCDHTFNPWWGCEKVSPGCKFCYAEAFAKRVGHKVWGPTGPRRLFGEKHWAEPWKWARLAAALGVRRRVFCASMADVFEDHPELEPERQKLWTLIRRTFFTCSYGCDWSGRKPVVGHDVERHVYCAVCHRSTHLGGLDWLLLTKRPENVLRMAPPDVVSLVWVGATVENQEMAARRLPWLLQIPSRVRFVSAEPLIERVDLRRVELVPEKSADEPGIYMDALTGHVGGLGDCVLERRVDWVIVGGESGPGARPFDVQWARLIQAQCDVTRTAFFMKQLGAVPLESKGPADFFINTATKKGDGLEEFPPELRVRQFPEVRQ